MSSRVRCRLSSSRKSSRSGGGVRRVRVRREILVRMAATVAEFAVPLLMVVLHFAVTEVDGFEESAAAIAEVELVLREVFWLKGYRLDAEVVVRGSARSDFVQGLGGD